LIHLGYFIRIKAVERVVDEVRSVNVLADVQFLAEPTCQRKIIVNLGCGYDPLPFVYLSATSSAVFVDVDYPDLIRHKTAIVRETSALSEVLGSQFGETSGEIRTEKYYAVGCDLSNLELFDKVLRDIEPDIDNTMILFISEVAITYMVLSSLSRS
jgi:tRNA wybutosine-synthesizing protein 4